MVKAGIADWKNAVGTGPFKLKTYVSGASVTYEKNPNYWGTTKIGGKEYKLPFVDRLEWPIIVDESTRLAALRTGKCDINEAVSWKYRESLEKTNPDLLRYRELYTTFAAIAMRMDKKPFSDIRVRRAISMAIDRKAYMDTQMGGEGEILSAPYSMGWPKDLYTPMAELPQSARELFEYNPTKAKQLLTEAGYPNGFKAEMVIYSVYGDENSMLAAFLGAIGVEVTLKPYDYTTYVSIMYGNAHKDMYSLLKGNGDPYAVFTIARTGSIWNPAVFNDKYFMDTLEKASTASNTAEAKKILKALNVYLIDQCPYAILPVAHIYAYAWPWVKNWYGEVNVNARSMGQIHARVWLDRDLREKMIGRR